MGEARKTSGAERSGTLERLASRSGPLVLAAGIALVAFLVYFNTLFNGFVYDDDLQVVDNAWIKDARNLPKLFTTNVWKFSGECLSNYYRPLMHVIYMANYHVFGLSPWGFHLVNVLFHVGSSVLVFAILRRVLEEQGPSPSASPLVPAFVAALVFVTHPVHAEAVAWVGGVHELSFTFFYLLSFHLYLRSLDGRGTPRTCYALSVLSFSAACLCKEPALTLPVALAVHDVLFEKGRLRRASHFARYAPYLAVIGIYLILRFNALEDFAPIRSYGELGRWGTLINIVPLFAEYLGKLLLPIHLNAFYVLHPIASLLDARGVVSVAVTVAFGLVSLAAYKKNRAAFLGLVMIVFPLLPALYIPALGENTFAERYLYLPSVGFVLVLASSFRMLDRTRPSLALAFVWILAVASGVFFVQTVGRNRVWGDNATLWSDTVRKSPDSATVQGSLGIALLTEGREEEARRHLRAVLEMKPNMVNDLLTKGNILLEKGLVDNAIREFNTAGMLKPDSVSVHNNLGAAYGRQGSTDQAIEQFEIAAQLDPGDPVVHHNLARAYRKKGLAEKAEEHERKAMALARSSGR